MNKKNKPLWRLIIPIVGVFSFICFVFFSMSTQDKITDFFYENKKNEIDQFVSLKKTWLKDTFEEYESYAVLIMSRTQMRKSLKAYQKSGEKKHLDKVSKIVKDVFTAFSSVKGISIFNLERSEVISIKAKENTSGFPFDGKYNVFTTDDGKLLGIVKAPLILGQEVVGYIEIIFSASKIKKMYQEIANLNFVISAQLNFLNAKQETLVIESFNQRSRFLDKAISRPREFLISKNYKLKLEVTDIEETFFSEISSLYLSTVLPLLFIMLFALIVLWILHLRYRDLLAETTERSKVAEQELSQLIYRTSHDLRSPVVAIAGLSSLLIESSEDDDEDSLVKSGLRDIHKSANSLAQLIESLLNIVDVGPENSEKSEVIITNFVNRLKDTLATLLTEKKVQFICNINVKSIVIDESKLFQVIYNIVVNAIKYSDNDKDEKYVSLSFDKIDGKYYILIEDNGVGIAQKDQEDMFKMFSRFNTQAQLGSGLGLYIVSKNVELIGGTITVDSTLGTGTLFKIVIGE